MKKMKFPNYTFGLFTGFCLAFLYMILPGMIKGFQEPQQNVKTPDALIEVVDTYKECDILRYAPSSGAKYQYFMDCSK